MRHFNYNGQTFTLRELSEFTGIKYTTLSERLKRGYTLEEAIADGCKVPESITEFVNASYPKDWHGLENSELYQIYSKWCSNNGYQKEAMIHFMRMLKRVVPNLRIVQTRVSYYDGKVNKRLIRVDGY